MATQQFLAMCRDAMSEAVDNAEIVLFGVSLACKIVKLPVDSWTSQHYPALRYTSYDSMFVADKESANCRLEANCESKSRFTLSPAHKLLTYGPLFACLQMHINKCADSLQHVHGGAECAD